jgi:dephospho-CoA kinase
MIVLGVTGSAAMGKTTVTRILNTRWNIPFWDADEEVHRLFRTDRELINRIGKEFPSCLENHGVNRRELRRLVFSEGGRLPLLESLVHPSLGVLRDQFLNKMKRLNMKVCILDVPLLFEVGWDSLCNITFAVKAPSFLQEQRLFKRDVTPSECYHMRARQFTDHEKSQRADFLVQSGLSKHYIYEQLQKIIRETTFA